MKIAPLHVFLAALTLALPAIALPERAENFRLTDQADTSHELYRLADSPLVALVSYSTACTATHDALPALKAAMDELTPRGVAFLGIDPDTADSRESVAEQLAAAGITLPVLLDPAQIAAKALGLTQYGEALVIAPTDNWKVVHRGGIAGLRPALAAQLDKQPLPAATPATGGTIAYATSGADFQKDVLPILEAKCASCHRAGGIAPFEMSSTKKLRSIADMIREVILTKRMPPWHADPHYSTFTNDRSLTEKEQATLVAWAEAGAPAEPAADEQLAKYAQPEEQAWALGKPDLVIGLDQPEELPAEGVVDYRYRYVPSGLTEDKWLRGLEVQAGNPKVVHHALIFIIYPKHYRNLQPEARQGLGGYFASFLPGAIIKPYPENTGQWVPAGSTFVFQMHYTTTGKPETDQTRMALYFHDTPPAEEFRMGAAHETEFAIPPKAMDYGVSADYRFRRAAKIWALSPHMHFRGSRFRFELEQPGGERQTLLNVPFYEFDWQPLYLLKEPISVPEDAQILCDGGFDNSRFNPRNPKPDQMVFFGEQSFEEMFIGYVGYSVPRDESRFTSLPEERVARMGFGQPITEQNIIGTKWRIAGRFVIEFKEEGRVVANGLIPGTWKMIGNRISIVNPIQPIDVGVIGDELMYNTRPLRYLRPGEENEPEQGERRRREGNGDGDNERRRRGENFLQQLLPGLVPGGAAKPDVGKPAEAKPEAPAPQAAPPANPGNSQASAGSQVAAAGA